MSPAISDASVALADRRAVLELLRPCRPSFLSLLSFFFIRVRRVFRLVDLSPPTIFYARPIQEAYPYCLQGRQKLAPFSFPSGTTYYYKKDDTLCNSVKHYTLSRVVSAVFRLLCCRCVLALQVNPRVPVARLDAARRF